MKNIELKMKATEVQVVFTMGEHEVAILAHIFGYLNGTTWVKDFSRQYEADDLDAVMQTMRGETEKIVAAIRAGREAMIATMRGRV